MKYRARIPKAKPPYALPGADELIARSKLVALLHVRLAKYSGKPANQVSKLVAYAEMKRHLFARIKSERFPHYRFGDVTPWARDRWPVECADFPLHPGGAMTAKISLPMLKAAGHGLPRPSTLSECHDALTTAYRKNTLLEMKNTQLAATTAALEGENTRLRECVEEHEQRARERSEKAKIAGKTGGRGNVR